MNCLALEQEEGVVIIDCGVNFPSADIGVDVYHPRFDYLAERSDRFLGVVITHGHEDHIGAVPYLLRSFDVPVYGPPHALALIRERLREHDLEEEEIDFYTIKPGHVIELGPFAFEPIRVTHSIADATALAIQTAVGTVIHTGDFKLDPSPPDGELTDEARLRAIGDEGVRLLFSDSTNVDSEGTSASERDVGEALAERILAARGRVVIGVFASNVQRLMLLGEIAERAKRRICLLGRSVQTHVRAAQALGMISWRSDLVVSPVEAAAMPRERVLIIAGGTQAERMSALPRLANGTHQDIRLDRGDLVILSSRIIPGNDRPVFDMMGDFLRLGVELVTRITDRRIHASGHAHRGEQRRMLDLVRPRAFVPVHGTLHHLMRHADLAREAGVEELCIAENGDVIEIGPSSPPAKVGRAIAGRVATFGGEELPDEVIRERQQIGRSGLVVLAVTLSSRSTPQPARVVARGVPDDGLLQRVERAVAGVIAGLGHRARSSDDMVTGIVQREARKLIEAQSGQRPVVVVTLTRVE